MKLQYLLTYDGEYSRVIIPELEGMNVQSHPDETYVDDNYLDIEHFSFIANFDPYDSDVFTTIEIQKEGGNGQSMRATSYYEQLTREEADGIIKEIIRTTLGLEDFELETDSEDLLEENEVLDDEEYEEDEDDGEIELAANNLLRDDGNGFSESFEISNGILYEYRERDAVVIIPEGVVEIASGAFRDCTYITEIVVPNSIKVIGDEAFSGCKSLQKINIPKDAADIGCDIFKNCQSLMDDKGFIILEGVLYDYQGRDSQLILPDFIKQIGRFAFLHCAKISSIVIPDSVTEIGEGAFMSCDNLSSVTLSSALKKLENFIFASCVSLETLHIPENVIEIGDEVFSGCRKLREIVIPNTVMRIGEKAFFNCDALTKIELPDCLAEIKNETFAFCSDLQTVAVPDRVSKIGDYAFQYCSSLKSVQITNRQIAISDSAFDNCEALADEQGYVIVNNILFGCYSDELTLCIPDGVVEIGDLAFDNCAMPKDIASITLPATVKNIRYSKIAFQNWSDLVFNVLSGSYALQYAQDNDIPYVKI